MTLRKDPGPFRGSAISFEDLIAPYPAVIARFRGLLADLEEEKRTFPWVLAHVRGRLHGINHWARVGLLGLAIARSLRARGEVAAPCLAAPGALEEAVILAAFFHDCARRTDGSEPDHGRRGELVWRVHADRKRLEPEYSRAISQALLFHVDHAPVDPEANEVTVCLSNGDRLDRVRLGEAPIPGRMYDDGAWRDIAVHAGRLLAEVGPERVHRDLGWD